MAGLFLQPWRSPDAQADFPCSAELDESERLYRRSPPARAVGARFPGRVGDYNIGVIDAVVDANGDLDSQNAFVGRVTREILDQSTVGALVTHGDPNSDYDNLLLGTDFQFLTNKFLNNYRVEVNAFTVATESDHPDFQDGLAPLFGSSVVLPADEFEIEVALMHVDEDFNPAMGFAPRTGVRRYYTRWALKPLIESKDWLRQVNYSYEGVNSRLIWEYRPGALIFLVLNQSYLDERTGLVRKQMDTTLKLGSIFRF